MTYKAKVKYYIPSKSGGKTSEQTAQVNNVSGQTESALKAAFLKTHSGKENVVFTKIEWL